MIRTLELLDPSVTHRPNALYQGYTHLRPEVLRFFSHAPSELDAAVGSRSTHSVPRDRLADALEAYHARLSPPTATLQAAAAIRDPRALCVVTGQQAGFLGGPLYTAYKILTAIRVARDLQASTGRPVVPVFWLASEDHDFREINHAFALRDGVARRVSFSWAGEGRPISDLPMLPEVHRALRRYSDEVGSSLSGRDAMELLSPAPEDTYCSWIARVILRLFGSHGLVIVEPRILAPLAGAFYQAAFSRTAAVRESLRRAARDLEAARLGVALDPEQAGVPFGFTAEGLRVRCPPDPALAGSAADKPELYSTDAALRPVLQDALLPNAVSVLGPGEISYQAMLRPLYELFEVPQPLLLPRMSVTVVSEHEADMLSRFGLDFAGIIAPDLDAWASLETLVPEADRARFRAARHALEGAFGDVAARAQSIDPGLRRAADAARERALRALGRVERKSYRALLSRQGLSVASLSALRACLAPRGSLQERVYPVPFLVHRHGRAVFDALLETAHPLDFRHHVAVAAPR